MKKRLLSAFLALAMVLTLIPATMLTASAANPSGLTNGETSIKYFSLADSRLTGVTSPGWYYEHDTSSTDKTKVYEKIETGVIINNRWFDTANDSGSGGDLRGTSITVIGGDHSINAKGYNLTLDMYGGTATVTDSTGTGNDGCKSLTVLDSHYATEKRTAPVGTVTIGNGIVTINSDTRDFDLKVTNVKVATSSVISWEGQQSRSIDLENVGTSSSFVVTKMSGVNTSDATKHSSQSVKVNKGTIGALTLVQGNSSQINLTDATAGAIELVGTGASLSLSGSSTAAAVTILGADGAKDVSAAPPRVSISKDSTIASLKVKTSTATEKCTQPCTVTIDGTVGSGGIELKNATLTVNGGTVNGDIKVDSGTVNVQGSRAKIGSVHLKESATFNLTGTNCTVGNLMYLSGANKSTVTFNVSSEPTNKITGIHGDYVKNNTIKGGTWSTGGTLPSASALDSNLQYQLTNGSEVTYFNVSQLGEALTMQKTTAGTLSPARDTTTGTDVTIEFKNGTTSWGTVTYKTGASLTLPTEVNNVKTPYWFDSVDKISYPGGGTYKTPITAPTPTNSGDPNIILDAQGGGTIGVISKLTDVAVTGSYANDLKATLSGNVITVTGAVDAGTTRIQLKLTTDGLKPSATAGNPDEPIDATVWLEYDSIGKSLTFASGQSDTLKASGMTLETSNGGLTTLMVNKTAYTLNGSGLVERSKLIKVVGETGASFPAGYNFIEVNVNVSGYTTDEQKNTIIKAVKGDAAVFDWSKSPVMLQAVNAALVGITDSQVTGWIEAAQRKAWTDNNSAPYDSKTHAGNTDYTDKIFLVPYLQVNVTNYEPAGSITATLVPSWRVEVHPDDNSGKYKVTDKNAIRGTNTGIYIAKSGTALNGVAGSLTKSDGTDGVELTMNLPFTGAVYAHQDNTYDYAMSNGKAKITFTHAGSSNGLGTVTINNTKPLVVLGTKPSGFPTTATTPTTNLRYFSTLQAAVDNAKHDEVIVLDQNYKGSTTINVTGLARTIYVQANGKSVVVANASGGLVENNNTGSLYTIKLNRNTAPVGGNITIASVTGGAASVNVNPANYGQTVTISLTPAAGYVSAGVSVTNASGQTVTVNGSGNSYTFTMPAGSVTVTPSFTRTNGNATVTVTNPNVGTGTASTNAGSNQVAPGTVVTVTTNPGVGQRTMGLNVSGATAVRTGVNQFQFTVPSGYTNVSVTPTFDRDNGTTFSDVWSSDYYSAPVAWALAKGITNGNGNWTFGPNDSCYRQDMVTFLWRAAGSEVVSNVKNPFWDVQPGSYYYNAVMWAVSKGITNGVAPNQFGVNQNVTRAQAVTFLYRAANSPSASTSNVFTDVSSNAWYARAVTWAANKGITNGDGSAVTFNPNGNCLRGQIVTFLYRDRA